MLLIDVLLAWFMVSKQCSTVLKKKKKKLSIKNLCQYYGYLVYRIAPM